MFLTAQKTFYLMLTWLSTNGPMSLQPELNRDCEQSTFSAQLSGKTKKRMGKMFSRGQRILCPKPGINLDKMLDNNTKKTLNTECNYCFNFALGRTHTNITNSSWFAVPQQCSLCYRAHLNTSKMKRNMLCTSMKLHSYLV